MTPAEEWLKRNKGTTGVLTQDAEKKPAPKAKDVSLSKSDRTLQPMDPSKPTDPNFFSNFLLIPGERTLLGTPDTRASLTQPLQGEGPLAPAQTRGNNAYSSFSGEFEKAQNEGEWERTSSKTRQENYQPTTDELQFLDSMGMLFHPDGRPKYPLTPGFKQSMARSGKGVTSMLGASPLGVLFSGSEEIGKGARYGREQIWQKIVGEDEFEEKAFSNALAKKEAELGRKPDHFERRDVWDEVFQKPGGTRGAEELLYEMALPATAAEAIIGKTVAWGLKPGWKGVKWVGGRLFSRQTQSEVVGAVADTAKMIQKPDNNFFNLPDIKVGTTRQEKVHTAFADMTASSDSHYDELADNLNNGRAEAVSNAESLGASISSELDFMVKDAFSIADNGTVLRGKTILPLTEEMTLPPTLADIAANLPKYWEHLTPDQQRVMKEIQERLDPIKKSIDDMAIDIGDRPDIMEGGFYIPRGQAFKELNEEAAKGVGRQGGGGYRKTMKFEAESIGIAKGYEYTPFKDAVNLYIRKAGNDIASAWNSKVLLNVEDADGNLVGTTMSDRIANHPVQKQAKGLTSQFINIRKQLLVRTGRFDATSKAAKRATRKAERAAEKGQRETERIQGRTTRTGEAAMQRTADAKGRYEAVAGEFNTSDLKEARSIINESISHGRVLVDRVRSNLNELKLTKRKRGRGARNIDKMAKDLQKEVDDAEKLAQAIGDDGMAFESAGGIGLKYEQLVASAERLDARWEKLARKQFTVEDQVQDLMNKRDLLEGMDAIEIAKRKQAMEATRQLTLTQRTETRLRNSWRMLEREQNRMVKMLDRTETRDIKRVQKQVKDAHGEAASIDDNAVKSMIQLHETEELMKGLKSEYKAISSELARTKKIAKEHPTGMGEIALPGVNGYSFPARLANSINSVIKAELPISGKGKEIIEVWNWHSSLYRGLRATLDDSGPWIQGLLRMLDNPVMASRAFGWHMQAWGKHGDELLGSYVREFNQKAVAEGTMSTDDMARQGLRVGGEDTEFMIGQEKGMRVGSKLVTASKKLGKAPGIKQANRAYGFYGDRLRIDWMKSQIDDLLAEGRTMQDIIDSGDAKEIAKGVNSSTGYSGKKFGGSFGDMLLFAPRFFQSRLETMARAGQAIAGKDILGSVEAVPVFGGKARRGLMKAGLAKDIPIRQRVARRSMLRFIAGGTSLTVLANQMLGNETDFRVMVQDSKGNWNYNSNFMRIRFANRDWSIFGTWDSMLRLMITAGASVTGNGNPIDSLRGLASGPVSLGWDLFSDETFEGREPKAGWAPEDPEWSPGDDIMQRIGYILESHIPFVGEETPEMGSQILKGNIGAAAALGAGEFFGGKSAPYSYTDLKQIIAKEKRGTSLPKDRDIPLIPEVIEELPGKGIEKIGEGLKKIGVERGLEQLGIRSTDEEIAAMKEKSPTAIGDGVGWDPENLSEAEKDIIAEDPRMKKHLEELNAKGKDDLSRAYENLNAHLVSAEKELMTALQAGAEPPRLGALIKELKGTRATEFGNFEKANKEELDQLDQNDPNMADAWAQKYYDIELKVYDDSGYMDFQKFEEERQAVLDEAAEVDPGLVEYITSTGMGSFRGERFENPKVREIIEEYDADLKIMREYFDVTLRVAQYHGLEDEFREYLKSTNKNEYLKTGKHAKTIKAINKEAGRQKEYLRKTNWLLEAKLYKWGSVGKPMNPVVEGMRQTMIQNKVQQGKDPMANLNDLEAIIQAAQSGQ